MTGVSAQSLTEGLAEVEPKLGSATLELASEIFGVLRVLDGSAGLRRALTDPARESAEKSALLSSLVQGKVSPEAEQIVTSMATKRWGAARDLSDALEVVAATTAIAVTERVGASEGAPLSSLEALAHELFTFRGTVADSHELQRALNEPQATEEAKTALAMRLVPGASEPARLLISQAVSAPRGSRPEKLVEDFAALAVGRQQRWIASVEVSRPLSAEQEQRLAAGLKRLYGRELTVNISVQPALVGGVRVKVADEVVDASVMNRLSELRRQLV